MIRMNIEEIYKKLDEVSPIDYDCGELCNSLCCTYNGEDYSNDELTIYLLPGEERFHEKDELINVPARELGYPFSWKKGVYLFRCMNPPHCSRKTRPIQCRTYPLIPHISGKGKFHLIFDDSEYPYECPLIHENISLNDDFIEVTYETWLELLENRLIRDLIEMDSRKRDNRKTEYKIIK